MLIYIYALYLCKYKVENMHAQKNNAYTCQETREKTKNQRVSIVFKQSKPKRKTNTRSKPTQTDCFCVCFVCVCVCVSVCLCKLCCVFQFVCFTGWCCCAVVFLRLSRWLFLFPAWFSVVVSPSYPPHPPTLNALTCCTCTPCDSVAVVGLEPYNLASPGY